MRRKPVSLPLAATLVLLAAADPSRADLPLARLNTVFPMGVQRGTAVEVMLAGADLEGLSALYFSQAGLSASPLDGGRFRVEAAVDCPVGLVDLRAVGVYGISNPRTFVVGSLPEQLEVEPNNTAAQPQAIPFGVWLNGRIDARADVDYYAIDLAAGAGVVIDCLAERIDSRLTGVLTLLGPSGQRLAAARATVGRDPRIDFKVSEAGRYLVKVADLTFDGSAEYFYRLGIHSQPVVDFAYPPVLRPGIEETVWLHGRNLPGAQPAEGAGSTAGRPSGAPTPLERLEVKLAAPTEPHLLVALSPEPFQKPFQLALDGFTHRVLFPDGTAAPVPLGITESPLALEVEPNDGEDKAQIVPVPVEIVGRCQRIGDDDWYRFTLKKGQTIEIDAASERAGAPADLALLLRRVLPPDPAQPNVARAEDVGEFDDNPANVGRFKCDTSTHDPRHQFAAPEDGDYLLAVHDRFAGSRGGEQFIYRVALREPTPDFRLAVACADEQNPSALLVRRGGTAFVHVFAARQGGLAGEITVDLVDPPAGLSAPPVIMGPNLAEVPLVFSAAADAPDFSGPITIRATSSGPAGPLERIARATTVVWPGPGNAPMPTRLARSFCAAVRPDAPYRLMATPDRVVLGQGAQLTLALKLERRWADFTTKIEGITALNLPPNVDNQAVVIGDNQTEAPLFLFFKRDVAPGSYSFLLRGTGQVPFSKAPEMAKANVPVLDPTPAVTVKVVPRPVEVNSEPKTPTVKPGQTTQVKVKLNRVNNFAGPVELSLYVPPGLAGVSAPPVTVAADQGEAVLDIAVAADVPVGDKGNLTARATVMLGEEKVSVDDQLVLKVAQ